MFAKKEILLVSVALLATVAHAVKEITPKMPELAGDCYQISSVEELYGFADFMDDWSFKHDDPFYGCAELTADIVVNQNVIKDGALNESDTANFAVWTPIRNFVGTFDGKGHSISGLYYNKDAHRDDARYVGFFRSFYGNSYTAFMEDRMDTASVKNLHIRDAFFKSNSAIGGIVGYLNSSMALISGCSVEGVFVGDYNVGGLVGLHEANGLEISNSYNKASVSGEKNVAGIVGSAGASYVALFNVYNVGNVTARENVGGIAGKVEGSVFFYNVFNAGSVTALEDGADVRSVIGYLRVKEDAPEYVENVFYLAPGTEEFIGQAVSAESFANGSVATVMHDFVSGIDVEVDGKIYEDVFSVDGSVWGQNVGVDALPNFSGSITGEPSFASITLSLDTGSTKLWTKKIPQGLRYKLPNVKRDGYKLMAWYDNEELAGTPVTYVPETQAEDVKYWGLYQRKYKVTLEMEDATVNPIYQVNSYIYTVGAKLPVYVSRKGYVFAGWYANKDLNGPAVDSISATATGDTTFYAKWLKIKTPAKDADGCYAISDAAELYGFAAIVNGTDGFSKNNAACGKLAKDIVVNENVLNADGSLNESLAAGFMQWNPLDSFAGTFDGNMRTISGLYFEEDRASIGYKKGIGFVGTTYGSGDEPVYIKNVGIVGSYFYSILAYAGGILGYVLDNKPNYLMTHIQNSYSSSTLDSYAGGIGGIVGGVDGSLDVTNCYNLGLLQDTSKYSIDVGGIVGWVGYGDAAYISNSYSAGKIVADEWVPIVKGKTRIGNSIYIDVTNSYYLESLASQTAADTLGKPVSAELLKNGAVAVMLHDGWDGAIWGQNVGVDDYPVLSGELKNADAAKKSVTFHTFKGDTAKYFDYYIPGYSKWLPFKSEVVPQPHYVFEGWYDNADYEGDAFEEISEDASGNLDFYAKWELETYRITASDPWLEPRGYFGKERGTFIGLREDHTYTYGEKDTVEFIPDSGYCFCYWRDDTTNTNPVLIFVAEKDTGFVPHVELEGNPLCAKLSSSSNSEEQSSSSVSSSSSSEPKSSSSSDEPEFSSSSKKGGKDALLTVAQVPQFTLNVVVRNIQVSGVSESARFYTVFDMQGHVLRKGNIYSKNFAIPVNSAGNYLVRIGSQVQRVSVK
ncbi:MAG: InlB B-repeat-containing protein [Fibrobacter sp.]|uniref:InlB B-repeat-containing protein n=1 Tax=Fibrobacter sp. TaxID=35828 RepID=UPI002A91EE55|nr:InlB B-repeat-containing protein [Fibrobacter sp.]MDY6264771.1 InlB B-repeat-containing protein [Fibrobacter sp.]